MAETAYMRVYKAIRKQIADRKYDIGDVLPPEPELEKEFEVSRTTVRKAVDMLVRERLVSVRQGFGTQVISRKAVQNLNRVTSMSESLVQNGAYIGLKSCYIEKIGAPKDIALLLGVPVRTPVICIYRIKTCDGKPISISKNYILEQLLPGLDLHMEIAHLYEYLREQFDIVYTSCRDHISACNATYEQALVLEVEPRTALFSVQRVCFMGSRPCEVDQVDIVAEKYEYEVFIGETVS